MIRRFAKYEGLGNDFVIVDGSSGDLDAALVRRMCDRHFGIGADGVLVIGPARTADAVASMTIFNADGTRSEMCGNGLRCAAAYVAEGQGKSDARFAIDTDTGPHSCSVHGDLVATEIGTATDEGSVDIEVAGRSVRLHRISVGNPHAVAFVDDHEKRLTAEGSVIAVNESFPGGTNVEYARLAEDGGIEASVWERGVGKTLACGTGAAATLAAACFEETRSFDKEVEVRLPGGSLFVTVDGTTHGIATRGPARKVFVGDFLGVR